MKRRGINSKEPKLIDGENLREAIRRRHRN
jgi:hypothetical protein